jgi:proline dehydrogenase
MSVLREALLRAGSSRQLRSVAQGSRVARPVVERFVAGTTQQDALRATAELLGDGRLVTLDHLGEDVRSAADAEHTVTAYRGVLAALGEAGMADRAEVSLKLSALGQSLPDGHRLALDGAQRICELADRVGTTVTLDMEDHRTTDSTLEILGELRADFSWVGAVLQAYLRRTEADCHDLAVSGSRVRLCKGAYAEPASVAFTGDEVEQSYRRCAEILLAGPGYPMLATHDPAMLAAVRLAATAFERTPQSYEYQMLYGIRPDEQRAIAPYGDQWYGYFMRRLAERPANLKFFLRSLRSRS